MLAAIVTLASASVARAVAPTFTVNSNADTPGTCPSVSSCTLRTAITDANANTGSTIQFSTAMTITPDSALPTIVKQTTVAGGGKVELDGSSAGASTAGLTIGSGGDHTIIAGLAIDGFGGDGIDVNGTGLVAIRDDLIGTDFSLTPGIGNGGDGINLTNSTRDTIGIGASGPAGNTIISNALDGISVGATSNATIQNNRIGVDSEDVAQPNGGDGIKILSQANVIGGVGAGNVISGNHGDGIRLQGAAAAQNTIAGNTIGLRAGDLMAGNATGISVSGGADNVIGGFAAGAGNTISGNQGNGIEIDFASGTQVQGNRIGTSPDGSRLRPNLQFGVSGFSASNTTIGGSASGNGNLISANLNGGIELADGTGNNVVQGNTIGTNALKTFGLPNGEGIDLFNENGDVIGGPGAAANTIAFNDGPGIGISSSDAEIAENSVFSNFGLGIDQTSTQGVTPDDPGDTDGIQNFPVLTGAVSGNGHTTIEGTLDTGPNRHVFLRFFSSPSCDPSGFGEGTTPLDNGTEDAITGANGHLSFSTTFGPAVAPGRRLTATTEGVGTGSSEFSACVAVTPFDHVSLSPRTQTTPEGGTATVTVRRTGALSVAGSVKFATHDGTARAGRDYRRTSGGFTFRAGQATKTIRIPILKDRASEGAEQFAVSLGRTSRLRHGTPATVTVRIPANG